MRPPVVLLGFLVSLPLLAAPGDVPLSAVLPGQQHAATIVRGAGMDLVVWSEERDSAWTLRATRVANDRPLDGEGIVIASVRSYGHEAAFDGESFSVVWDQPEGTFLRRIAMDGTVIDPAPIFLDAEPGVSTIASLGGGEVLVGWQLGGRVAILRDAIKVSGIDLAPALRWLSFFEATSFDDSYLVVSIPLLQGCQFTCYPPPVPIEAHRLSRDGNRIGEPLRVAVTDNPQSLSRPIAAGGAWFFTWPRSIGPEIVRVSPSAPLLSRTPALSGELRSTPVGIEIVATALPFRAMLSRDLEPVWYEPLPIGDGERAVGVLSSEASFLVELNERYFVRPATPRGEADLAVVHRERRYEPFTVIDDVTIEHRGGTPVDAVFLHLWGEPYVTLSASAPVDRGRIERRMLPGDSIQVSIRGGSSGLSSRMFIALPAARDAAPANNVLKIPPNGPLRDRRRTVAR